MQKPAIRDAIREQQSARSARVQLAADDLLEELAVIVKSDVRHFLVDDDGTLTLRDGVPDRAWRAVSSVKHKIRTFTDDDGRTETNREIEFRLWDKNTAIKTAREHLGLTGAPPVEPHAQAAAIRDALRAMDDATLTPGD